MSLLIDGERKSAEFRRKIVPRPDDEVMIMSKLR